MFPIIYKEKPAMASFISYFTVKTTAAVFQDNFTNSLRTVLLEKNSKRRLLKMTTYFAFEKAMSTSSSIPMLT